MAVPDILAVGMQAPTPRNWIDDSVPASPRFGRSRSSANYAMSRVKAALGLSLLLPVAMQAEDWPQFRGPNRDGVWNESGILERFPAEGLKIRWRAPVGPGWSSPVVRWIVWTRATAK